MFLIYYNGINTFLGYIFQRMKLVFLKNKLDELYSLSVAHRVSWKVWLGN